jgi:hypothetical protein
MEMRDAARAHGIRRGETGRRDGGQRSDWYPDGVAREQAGVAEPGTRAIVLYRGVSTRMRVTVMVSAGRGEEGGGGTGIAQRNERAAESGTQQQGDEAQQAAPALEVCGHASVYRRMRQPASPTTNVLGNGCSGDG